MCGNGCEKFVFLIFNDFDIVLELLVSDYVRRWWVENVILEVVKFFNFNVFFFLILVKVYFDVIMIMIVDMFYSMLVYKLWGFESCDVVKIN